MRVLKSIQALFQLLIMLLKVINLLALQGDLVLVLLEQSTVLGLIFSQVTVKVLNLLLVHGSHFIQFCFVLFLKLLVSFLIFILLLNNPSFKPFSFNLIKVFKLDKRLLRFLLNRLDLIILFLLLHLDIFFKFLDLVLINRLSFLDHLEFLGIKVLILLK